MNLKKAFRYQNLITALLTSANEKYFDASFYKTTSVISKKSELNNIALNGNYEDEEKNVRGDGNKRYNPFSSGITPKKIYDFNISREVCLFLASQKAELTDAIAKAKSKIKIPIPDEDMVLGYDAAIAISKSYRQYVSTLTAINKDLTDTETESSSSQKVIVSTELPPTDGIYSVVTKVTVDEGIEEAVTSDIEKTKELAEYISNEIEAAALSTTVKFETNLKLTDTIDSLYNKFAAELSK